jgi:hypothetical protein
VGVECGGRRRWRGALTVRSAVLSAVRGLGAVALSDAPALGAGRAVVVVSPGADSAPSWMASARAISEPWMGDVLYAVRNDTTLGSASRSLEMLTDSTIMPPFVVLRRAANGAPVVMGAAIPGVGDRTRVLLLSRASAEHLATAALLLAAARAMTPNGGVTFADVAALPDDLLQRWQRAPRHDPLARKRPASCLTPSADTDFQRPLPLATRPRPAWCRGDDAAPRHNDGAVSAMTAPDATVVSTSPGSSADSRSNVRALLAAAAQHRNVRGAAMAVGDSGGTRTADGVTASGPGHSRVWRA